MTTIHGPGKNESIKKLYKDVTEGYGAEKLPDETTDTDVKFSASGIVKQYENYGLYHFSGFEDKETYRFTFRIHKN